MQKPLALRSTIFIERLRRGLHVATLHSTRQRVHSLDSERAASKLAMRIARMNENAGLSAARID